MENYRDEIEKIIERYSRAGLEDLKRAILEGSPEVIDRNEALKIAEWLVAEAPSEWANDPRWEQIAIEIENLVSEN